MNHSMETDAHALALPPGYRLGRYRIERVLGFGGFGITYLATDESLGRNVAIKELLPSDFATRSADRRVTAKTSRDRDDFEWARARFMEEGRALAACSHPNVVDVYEMLEANGTAYMVTKYEEGQNLERWLRMSQQPLSEKELRQILFPLLSGLEQVHASGFLHRDIKPENIYVTKSGRPVLLDFGSARQTIGSKTRALTAIVTPGYAPFEQYQLEGEQGPWTDIYSLGAVCYRAITGRKPIDAPSRMQAADPYRPLALTHTVDYHRPFLEAIDRALRIEPSQRPRTVAAWRAILGEAAPSTPSVSSKPDQDGGRKPGAPARTRGLAIGIGWTIGSLVLVVGIGGFLVGHFANPLINLSKTGPAEQKQTAAIVSPTATGTTSPKVVVTSTPTTPVPASTLSPSSAQPKMGYQLLKIFKEQSDASYVAWSPDGQTLAASFGDTLKVWNSSSWSLVQTLKAGRPLTWSPDSQQIAAVFLNDVRVADLWLIKIWDVTSGRVLRTFSEQREGHSQLLSWSPDGSRLAANGQKGGGTTILDAQTGQVLSTIQVALSIGIAWAPDSKRLICRDWLDWAKFVNKIVSADTGQVLKTLSFDGRVIWSPDGQRLAATNSGQLIVCDSNSYERLWELPGNGYLEVAWSRDGKLLATGNQDGTIDVFDAATGHLLVTLTGHHTQALSLSWSPDGLLASGADTVNIWSIGP